MKQNRFKVALADQVNVSSATLFAPIFIVGTNYSSFQTFFYCGSVAYDQIKTRLSESEAEAQG